MSSPRHLQAVKNEYLASVASQTHHEDFAKDEGEGNNPDMEPPITRNELDAKLKTVELTLDRRVDGLEHKLDGLKSDIGSTKSTVLWATALIVGTIVATAAMMVSSFDSGRQTAQMMSEAEKRIDSAVNKAADEIKAATNSTVMPLPAAKSSPPASVQPPPK